MIDRAYTQADYDRVTNLYNEYQNKKWSYTPEQQQKIEDAFGNARAAMTERIATSKNKVVNMWNDDQWNSRAEYWDGRREIVNRVTPEPSPTPRPKQPITPESADDWFSITPLKEWDYIDFGDGWDPNISMWEEPKPTPKVVTIEPTEPEQFRISQVIGWHTYEYGDRWSVKIDWVLQPGNAAEIERQPSVSLDDIDPSWSLRYLITVRWYKLDADWNLYDRNWNFIDRVASPSFASSVMRGN